MKIERLKMCFLSGKNENNVSDLTFGCHSQRWDGDAYVCTEKVGDRERQIVG